MKKLLIAFVLLAGCQQRDDSSAANQAAPAADTSTPQPKGSAGRLATLVGLYEGGEARRPTNQMCIVEGKGGEARFGLVVWGEAMHSCSGSGTVDRQGDTLRIKMAGDEACTVDAAISGTSVTLPQSLPAGCAYYCGARARLAGASFTQKGTTAESARKAKDLVGDQLCPTR